MKTFTEFCEAHELAITERSAAFDALFPAIADFVSKKSNPKDYTNAVADYKKLVDDGKSPTNSNLVNKVARMYKKVEASTLSKVITDLIKNNELASTYAV